MSTARGLCLEHIVTTLVHFSREKVCLTVYARILLCVCVCVCFLNSGYSVIEEVGGGCVCRKAAEERDVCLGVVCLCM